MTTFPVLMDLGLVVVGGASALLLTRPLKLPPILAFLAVGLVLGPLAGLLAVDGSVELFSELGIALLLFLVGLELSLARVRDVGVTALVVGLGQVGATALLGAGLAIVMGFAAADAVILGLVTAFSSTVVVVSLLDRMGELSSIHGRLAVGVLLVQDLVVAITLTVLAGLSEAPGADEVGAVLLGLGRSGIGIVALCGTAWAGGRWLLPRLLGWVAASGEVLFILSLTWCFGLVLMAEFFHVSLELGAFIAGVTLAQLPYGHELERRVHPLVHFFLAVFFVSLGAGMSLELLPRIWLQALTLSAFVLLIKPLLVFLLLRQRVGHDTGFRVGITLGQTSEFSFIVVGLAVGAQLTRSPFLPELVAVVGLVTIGASALLVPRATPLLRILPGRPRSRPASSGDEEGPSGHVVVVGMNTLGRTLVRRLAARGEEVVAVDTDPGKLADLPGRAVFGDARSPAVLEEAGARQARLLVSALRIEDVNGLLTFRCRRLGVPVSVHAFEPALAEELLELGADHLIVSKLDGAGLLEAELRRRGGLG